MLNSWEISRMCGWMQCSHQHVLTGSISNYKPEERNLHRQMFSMHVEGKEKERKGRETFTNHV
uniref:Uncharacterized protein n=1 Tax=Nelumbo nucifera TaxID=4432 RepID=A0A822YWS5_NELNU|nr:TPA_asm: hypothetical protein HUJ06_006611 [Nelumbo nucifera]